MSEAAVFSQIGEAGFAALTAAFYRRVRVDEVIGPLYPANDWDGAEHRLREFLVFRFGGPPRYLEERGHPRLRMRHAPFAIGIAERDRWLALMSAALEESAIPEPARSTLLEFFGQVAEFLRNTPEETSRP